MNRFSEKKVLVTGASGFIGSHLTRGLLDENAHVTIVSRYGSIEQNVRLAGMWDDLHIVEGDIRYIDSLMALRQTRFDYVFHLAAYNHVGNSFQHPNEAMETNCQGAANVLASVAGYERFVYISTSETYGLQDSVPFVESMYPHPVSPYSIGKYAGELYSLAKKSEADRPIVVLRPFNAFGPYQSTRAVIPELIVKCLTGVPVVTTEGKQTREFNFVTNLVEGMLLAALASRVEGEVINLGCGQDIAICDLTRRIHAQTGSEAELEIGALPTRDNEIWRMYADASKAERLLGWKPTVSFEDGLEATIAWFRKYVALYHEESSPLVALCHAVAGKKDG